MKKIKIILSLLFVVTFVSLVSSCQQMVDKAIEVALQDAKKELPTLIDEGMVMDDITLGDNGIVYHITVDEDVYDMDMLDAFSSESKIEMINALRESVNDDKDQKEFIESAVSLNKPLNYRYEGNVSGKTVRIKISVSEMKDILDQ